MSASFELSTGGRGRIIGNNLLVRPLPPRTESRGGVIFANIDTANAHAIAKVVAIGHLTGDRAKKGTTIPGLSVGDHVVYIRMLGKMDSVEQMQRTLDTDLVRIRPSDVLLVIDAEDVDRVA